MTVSSFWVFGQPGGPVCHFQQTQNQTLWAHLNVFITKMEIEDVQFVWILRPPIVQHLQFKRKNCNLITSGYGSFKSICEGSESVVWANNEEFFLNRKTKHGGPHSIITVVPQGYNVAILCAG